MINDYYKQSVCIDVDGKLDRKFKYCGLIRILREKILNFCVVLARKKMVQNTKIELEVFQLSQEYFRLLGINIISSTSRQINLRTLTSILVFFLGPISCAHYFFFKSKTFIEYIISSYLFCCIFICLLIHPYVTWITPDLYKFIESLKKIAKKRE